MIRYLHIVLLYFVASGLLATTVQAYEPSEDVVDAVEPSLFQRYSRSKIVAYSQGMATDYWLALGAPKTVNGAMMLEYSERLRGALTRITYQAPDGDSAEAMFAHFAAQLQQQSHRVLFECHGRECGSSNAWANQIFDIPKLYGPERYQHYLAAQVDAPQGPLFVALYSIKRGNKRVYTQLDLLQPSDAFRELDANPDMLLAQLKQQGFFELSRLSFDEQDQLTVRGAGLLDSMIVALQKNVRLRLYVVGHVYASQTLERLQRRGLIRAQAVVDALVEGGIDVERLSAQGVGPLSPDGGKNNRVVLVVKDLF